MQEGQEITFHELIINATHVGVPEHGGAEVDPVQAARQPSEERAQSPGPAAEVGDVEGTVLHPAVDQVAQQVRHPVVELGEEVSVVTLGVGVEEAPDIDRRRPPRLQAQAGARKVQLARHRPAQLAHQDRQNQRQGKEAQRHGPAAGQARDQPARGECRRRCKEKKAVGPEAAHPYPPSSGPASSRRRTR